MWGDRSNDKKKPATTQRADLPNTNTSATNPPPAPVAPVTASTAPTPTSLPETRMSTPPVTDNTPKTKTTSTLGPSLQIEGTLKSDEDVVILGSFKGMLVLKENNLTIGRGGRVEANMLAKTIRVEGDVVGDLYAQQISIQRTGSALGNLNAPRVVIEDGANFKGNIDMNPKTVEDKLSKATEFTQPSGNRSPRDRSAKNNVDESALQ